jgi:hypothetical protein
MTKGFKKSQNGPKQSINRSLAAHYHHCKLRIDQKAKNTPLLKDLIPRALVDETNFCSDQVGINEPLLQFNTSFFVYFSFFGGCALLKRCGPTCMWAVQGKHAYAHGQKTTFPSAYTIVLNTARVHPQKHGKF